MTSTKAWKDVVKNTTGDFTRMPSGRVERLILSHVFSADTGLLDGCMLLYRGSKSNKSADYHSEMNWDVFSDCCNRAVFPAIPAKQKKAVIVLDRATYHTQLDEEEERPNISWNKGRTRLCGPSDD